MTKKAKGPTPTLISCSNGTPKIVIAKKTSPCSRCKKPISMNERCVDLRKLTTSFTSTRRLCIACFLQTIEKTKADILKIEKEIIKGS